MSAVIETAPPVEAVKSAGQLVKDSYNGKIHPDWCPGCGDFSVLSALQAALFELGLKPHQVVVISGIGCSSNLPGYINTYGMHTLHGRSLAVGTGVKLGNHELKVICTGGDGDGFGIGGNHFLHTMRRNVDLTYIVMDNQIYGLTTGQCSPTSVKGMKTKSTPHGNVENPINPIPLAMVGGATYVARGFSGKQKHLVELLKGAIQHKGFSFVDVFSPCVTYNKDNTYQWFNPRVKILEEQGHVFAGQRRLLHRRAAFALQRAGQPKQPVEAVGRQVEDRDEILAGERRPVGRLHVRYSALIFTYSALKSHVHIVAV